MIKLIKIHDARLIPRKLIEQVPNANADDFYEYFREAWKFKYDFIYAVIDNDHVIQGYAWYQVNILDKNIFINAISIWDRWKNTGLIKEIGDLIKKDMVQMGLSKIFFLTDKPAFYEKHMGMVRTKEILLRGDF